MKKYLLASIIVSFSLISCSPETDENEILYLNKTDKNKLKLNNKIESDYYFTLRDSIDRNNDSISEGGNPKPIKP